MFDLGMKEMALTGTETGGKASNFKTFVEKDIGIGDRAYCGKQGIACLLGRGISVSVWDKMVSCV
jgi:hypothetical protein